MGEYIRVGRPRRRGNRITVPLDASSGVAHYFGETEFWSEYPREADLSSVPEGILAIPAVGTASTVAWATGARLEVDTLDATFSDALGQVGATFQTLYPRLRVSEAVIAVDRMESHQPIVVGGTGLLFSGGIDSHTSLVEHHDKITDLFSVWGADTPTADDGYWNDVLLPVLAASPPAQGKALHVIKSNLRDVVDERRLERGFAHYLTNASWWGGMQHGLALTSVTAPICYQRGVPVLLIASSFSEQFSSPWGSNPATDNQIAWIGTQVQHDGFHRTRQEKISDVLAPYVGTNKRLLIAACYQRGRGTIGINCGICEKCVRTQTGFLVAGVDPNQCGFEMDDQTLPRTREKFDACAYPFTRNTVFQWEDIQRAIPDQPADLHGSRSYFDWLRRFDISAYGSRAIARFSDPRRAETIYYAELVFRRLPFPVQQWIRRVRLR